MVIRSGHAVERFTAGPWAVPTVGAAALGVFSLVSFALPLHEGRDLPRYLLVYAELLQAHVVYPFVMVSRTPVTPIVAGALLDGGPLVAELGAAVLYASSVTAWCLVARRYGALAALATAVALLLYPGYVLLFHELSSDALFAAAFALLAVVCARVFDRPTAVWSALLGGTVALLVLVRPVAQILLLLALVPLVATGWHARVRGIAAFAVAAAVPLLAWSFHNQARLDDFTIARGGGTTFPLFRAFVADRIVEPGNGPASRELARVVARDLLPYQPYRAYGIGPDEFFDSGSSRMHDDLTVLSDRTWGWDDDYRHLARVGREAVLAHPGTYARGVARDVSRLLLWPLYPPATPDDASATPVAASGEADAGDALPIPSEGQPIPSSRESPAISTPDGRNREVWASPTDHHVVFGRPGDAARAAALDRRVNGLLAGFPDRGTRDGLVGLLDSASRWYPRPFMWLLVGLVALAWRRPVRSGLILVIAGAAVALLVVTSLAVYAVAQYAVPVVPAFVLLTTAGLLGRYRPVRV
jgi:hypothetical protein